MKYRGEIDGLRALAVIPVILFHAGLKGFGGGFVGVDVFFVISGYLITTILLQDMEAGGFSIVHFYERRARRILPALFLVMLVSLPFAWFCLLPDERKSFSQSLVAVSVFASNILFWQKSGYFDAATELKPLIHTWSLAVEEQYYVLFPLLLLLTKRFGNRLLIVFFAVLAVASLAGAQYLSGRNQSFDFYLLPTRAWELLIGAMVAVYYTEHNIKKHKHWLAESASLLGLALILFAIFAYNEKTPFPGIYALAPTLGAALIIVFTTNNTFVGKILGSKFFVSIGLISYSTYLWHQPLFAFARNACLDEPGAWLMGVLAMLSFPLAYLTWRYVERPFRNKHRISRQQVFVFCAVGSSFFIVAGVAGHATNGFLQLWKNDHSVQIGKAYDILLEAQKKSTVYATESRVDNGDCIFDVEDMTPPVLSRLGACHQKYGQGIAIIGDSHAINLFNTINYQNAGRLKFIAGFAKNGCHLPTRDPNCHYYDFLEFVKGNPKTFSKVIYEKAGWLMLKTKDHSVTPDFLQKISLAARFDGIDPDRDVIDGVLQYLDELGAITPVVWFGPRIEPQISPKLILHFGCQHAYDLRENQYETYLGLDRYLSDSIRKVKKLEYLSQLDAYKFNFPQDFMSCENTYWMDGNHYSNSGEQEFAKRFDIVGFLTK